VHHGTVRGEGPYLWPDTILQPPRPPKIVYLDLSHWIRLSGAMAGRSDSVEHQEWLTACLAASESRVAVFPISDSLVYEASKFQRHHQRKALRKVIEALSKFTVIMSRADIATHEIEATLDNLLRPNPNPINTMRYLDWGLLRALGRVGNLRVATGDGTDITQQARAERSSGPEAFDQFIAQGELDLQRRILDGPSNSEEEADLRSRGWDSYVAARIAGQRCQHEVDLVTMLSDDPHWRQGRLRDLVSAREMYAGINDIFHRGVIERGASLDNFFGSPEEARKVFDAMPSFDVTVTLKTSYHQNPEHRWTPNDLHDIDALASTIPYCDLVVTDKAAAAQVTQTGLGERLGTVVVAHLPEMLVHL
jgi:hypothetical protein